MDNTPERARLGNVFDKTFRSLHGLPDVTHTKPTTVRSVTTVKEEAQTFIVQTFRQRDVGDTIFVEYIGAEGSVRLAFPPEVAAVIARQYDALGTTNRRRAAKAEAARRKAAGIVPGFAKGRKKAKTEGR